MNGRPVTTRALDRLPDDSLAAGRRFLRWCFVRVVANVSDGLELSGSVEMVEIRRDDFADEI